MTETLHAGRPDCTVEPRVPNDHEIVRGALVAWAVFLALFAVIMLINAAAAPFAMVWALIPVVLVIAAPISLTVMVAGMCPARCVARALRNQHRPWVHAVTYSVLGGLVGSALLILLAVVCRCTFTPGQLPLIAGMTGTATGCGWAWSWRHPVPGTNGREEA